MERTENVPGGVAATTLFIVGIFSVAGGIYALAFDRFSFFSVVTAASGVISGTALIGFASVVENVRAIRVLTAQMLDERKKEIA